jgi:hypothetical protein
MGLVAQEMQQQTSRTFLHQSCCRASQVCAAQLDAVLGIVCVKAYLHVCAYAGGTHPLSLSVSSVLHFTSVSLCLCLCVCVSLSLSLSLSLYAQVRYLILAHFLMASAHFTNATQYFNAA